MLCYKPGYHRFSQSAPHFPIHVMIIPSLITFFSFLSFIFIISNHLTVRGKGQMCGNNIKLFLYFSRVGIVVTCSLLFVPFLLTSFSSNQFNFLHFRPSVTLSSFHGVNKRMPGRDRRYMDGFLLILINQHPSLVSTLTLLQRRLTEWE